MKSKLLISVLFSLFFIALLYRISELALGPISSIDVFWHLRLGLDFLEKGWFPTVDHYSVPNMGKPYLWQTPWFFQWLVAAFYKVNRELETLKLLKWLLFVLPFVTCGIFYLKKKISLTGLIILSLAIYFAIINRPFLRPDLVVYSLLLFNVLNYFYLRQNLNRNYYFHFFIIQLFWSLYHSSAIIGLSFVLLSQVFLLPRYFKAKRPTQMSLNEVGLWNLIIFMTGFANTKLKHWLLVSSPFSEWTQKSDEFKSLFESPWLIEHSALIILFLISMVIYLRKKNYDLILLSSFFVGMWVWHERMTTHSTIVLASCLAFCITNLNTMKTDLLNRFLLALSILFVVFYNPAQRFQNLQSFNQRFPANIMNYLEQKPEIGPLLTEWGFASYVMFRRGVDNPVFMDGRSGQLYTSSQLQDFYKMIHQLDGLKDYVEEKKLPFLLASESFRPDRLLETATLISNFRIEYEKDDFYLFSQRSTLVETSKLFSPRLDIYKQIDEKILIQELQELEVEPLENQKIKEIINFYLKYINIEKSEQVDLLMSYNNKGLSFPLRRLLAQLALTHKRPDLSLQIYKNGNVFKPFGRFDTYRICLMLIYKGEHLPAARLLSQISEQHLSFDERTYFFSLLAILLQNEAVVGAKIKFHEVPTQLALLSLETLKKALLEVAND